MRNKIVGILLSFVMALVFAGTVSAAPNEKVEPQAPEKAALQKYKPEFHVGEKPVRVFVDKDTKVRVEVFPSSDPETDVNSLTSGWDLVGTDTWTVNGNFYDMRTDATFYSTGGDYMFRVPAHTGSFTSPNITAKTISVDLKEYDPDSADEFVTFWSVRPESVSYDYIVRDIGKYVDGSNGRAEFYTIHQSNYMTPSGYLNVGYYD